MLLLLLLLLQNSAGREGIGMVVVLQEVIELGRCMCVGSQHLLEIQTGLLTLALLCSAGMSLQRVPYFL